MLNGVDCLGNNQSSEIIFENTVIFKYCLKR